MQPSSHNFFFDAQDGVDELDILKMKYRGSVFNPKPLKLATEGS